MSIDALQVARPLRSMAAAAALCCVWAACGDATDAVLVITVSNGAGSGAFQVRVSDCTFDAGHQLLSWSSGGPTAIRDVNSAATICTVNSAHVTIRNFARINLDATIDAGTSATSVIIDSAVLKFPTIAAADAQGQVGASTDAEDLNGDGFSLTPLEGATVFSARINGTAPGGTVLSELLGPITGSGGAALNSSTDPPAGLRPLGVDVSDVSCRLAFVLSAGDRGVVSGKLNITPAPSCTVDADGDGVPDCLAAAPSASDTAQPAPPDAGGTGADAASGDPTLDANANGNNSGGVSSNGSNTNAAVDAAATGCGGATCGASAAPLLTLTLLALRAMKRRRQSPLR